MGADELAVMRMRVEEAGLQLDDARLGALTALLREFSEMVNALEGVEIDPTDLALEPYDPAWPEGTCGQ